ncbi:MAG TPA: protein-glutamate O-methyltransferase CheR [Polyangiaceae bacterium]
MSAAAAFPQALVGVVRALVEERTGIHYGDADQDILTAKVLTRALEAGFESPLDYYYFLRYDDPHGREFDALVETLVVSETYFFREARQLRVLCDEVLARVVATGRRPRVWCAAAATGEEPLTLAMLLSERGLLDRVEIVASDISAKAIARAKEGMYGPRSFRAIDGIDKERWFDAVGEQSQVRAELRNAIAWRRLNLIDEVSVQGLGSFDVILCRNVLIYFDDETVRRVASLLARSLEERGHLVVGASESLLRFGTLLTCEEREGAFFYCKAAA